MKQLYVCCIALLLCCSAYAQKVITGNVTDTSGPVVGASIVVKGTSRAALSGADGRFSIKATNGEVLKISMIGYQTKEITIAEQNTIHVLLESTSSGLGEVVVTALGLSRDKRALGYSITELKGQDIANANVVNPINALQGKVAGVQINMGSSGPQSSQRILIRGNTSLTGNNQPIFVIDGVIIDNETTKTGTAERDFGNDLKNLNADDFESVSILKGAAATALYGSRASNGVILITTKKGKKNQGLGISFSETQQWETVYGYPHMQNEFGQGTTTLWSQDANQQDIRNTNSSDRDYGVPFDGQPYTVNGGLYSGKYQAYPNNLKDLYQTGRFQNTNVALSNGTEKSAFRFSYSNLSTDGITPRNTFGRNSFSLNAQHEISSYISASGGFNYVHSTASNPTYQGQGFSPIYDFLYSVPREYDLKYWRKNYVSQNGDGYNANDPWSYSKTLYDYLLNDQTQKEDNFRANLNLDFKITDWLKLTTSGDIYKLFTTNETKKLATGTTEYSGAQYILDSKRKDQFRIRAVLSADKKVGNFGINASAGVEKWKTSGALQISQTNNGLLVPGVFDLSNSFSAATTSGRLNTDQKTINSAYGFINADWKNQLYLDITGRNDWSSSLMYANGKGNVSYFYPSFSLSWIASETFKLPTAISFAKLRASYAIVGKDVDPYVITTPGTYNYGGLATDNMFGGSGFAYYIFANSQLGAQNLKPEKQHAIELGADIRFLDNRIGIDFAYYKTNTKNQILALSTPEESGVTSNLINAGNIQNAGIEVLITGTPIKTRNVGWDLTLNLTRNRNKIIALANGVSVYKLNGGGGETGAYATTKGAYGDIYTSQAYLKDDQGNNLLTGNGVFTQAGVSTKIGSIQPDLLGGLSSNLRWKKFTLGVLLDARFGGDMLSLSHNYGMYNGTLASTLHGRTEKYGGLARTLADGRVVHDGIIPDGVFQAGTVAADGTDLSGKTYKWAVENGHKDPVSASDYYGNLYGWASGIRSESIYKCSWLVLREISLMWNLPVSGISKYVKNASLGVSVRNVAFLYNSLPDNLNPEGLVTTYGSEYMEAGGSPLSRNYSVKLNVTF
ncbi:iron complex outermembrane recepter protein [Chitinophaga costaii]|uniref:Iron complex outermembrane recepter protein n=1 Tax=Chitinophaga costaii TaxID=1335309 RepID=A0A1C3ZMU9_9BACT|nr:SusC/RagA family TonB-linked outer membrane protein [Chitinophaga costaii]PUZ30435.1 SusC/RagA family TonB-linked outer membrane protein [Chitinophaga costaii]SCB83562.1 iron complex outermembrane recepter protein [Chitinophaga costaii]